MIFLVGCKRIIILCVIISDKCDNTIIVQKPVNKSMILNSAGNPVLFSFMNRLQKCCGDECKAGLKYETLLH